ncbi:MAG: hypothetical protein LQ344_005686 [Seirophora lacunosa]|nr:MAG: hypothetical protein LQ344_005686 [Seirophora lacunosa]
MAITNGPDLMIRTTLPQTVAEEGREHDNKSESGSLLVRCGSLSAVSLVPTDSPETRNLHYPDYVPFDVYTQQLGSHLAYRSKRSEVLALSMELENLLPRASTPVADVHEDLVSLCQNLKGHRRQDISDVIGHVNRLFAESDNECRPGAEAFTSTRKGSLPSSEDHKYAGHLLYDLENQIHANGLQSNDKRAGNSAWLDAGRILCFMILGAALAWHCLVFR